MAGTRKSSQTKSDSSPPASTKKGTKRAAPEHDMSPPSKRGPGRPRKDSSKPDVASSPEKEDVTTAKRRRGRSKNESSAASPDKSDGANTPAVEETTATPAKRGRGRAKKDDSAASPEKDDESSPVERSGSPPAKRGRGRPAKDAKKAVLASSPEKPVKSSPATKKQAGSSHGEKAADTPAKRGRGRPPKKQTTIEETMDVDKEQTEGEEDVNDKSEENGEQDVEMTDAKEVEKVQEPKPAGESTKDAVDETMKDFDKIEDDAEVADQINGSSQPFEDAKSRVEGQVEPKNAAEKETSKSETNGVKAGEKNAFEEVKADAGEVKEAAKEEQEKKTESISKNNESVVEDSAREAEMPRSILEKGIIYFFFRARVGIEDPQGLEDVARSYIVLRPIPLGAKIGEGPLEDSGNARLLALPKKMLPKSGKDRFLMFVDKAKSTIKDLRDRFAGNEYATKTSGRSNTPAATPFAEGIYAITSTGRESHLAYVLTMPKEGELGNVQNELGVQAKGSYICSLKNPDAPGPANATLDNPAKYPEELQKKFRGLRWMPLEPEFLDYEASQFLIIGEGQGNLGKAVEEQSKDAKDDEKEKPEEEMEKLEEEDHDRVEHLKEDDPVFADLGLSSKEYNHLQTTW